MRRLLEEDALTVLARYKRLCFYTKEFRSLRNNETIMNDGNMFNSISFTKTSIKVSLKILSLQDSSLSLCFMF